MLSPSSRSSWGWDTLSAPLSQGARVRWDDSLASEYKPSSLCTFLSFINSAHQPRLQPLHWHKDSISTSTSTISKFLLFLWPSLFPQRRNFMFSSLIMFNQAVELTAHVVELHFSVWKLLVRMSLFVNPSAINLWYYCCYIKLWSLIYYFCHGMNKQKSSKENDVIRVTAQV